MEDGGGKVEDERGFHLPTSIFDRRLLAFIANLVNSPADVIRDVQRASRPCARPVGRWMRPSLPGPGASEKSIAKSFERPCLSSLHREEHHTKPCCGFLGARFHDSVECDERASRCSAQETARPYKTSCRSVPRCAGKHTPAAFATCTANPACRRHRTLAPPASFPRSKSSSRAVVAEIVAPA